MSVIMIFIRLCFLSVFFFGFASSNVRVGKTCELPNRTSGVCTIIHDCKEIIDQLKQHIVPVRVSCGFREDDTEIVCCSDKKTDNNTEDTASRFKPYNYHDHPKSSTVPLPYPVDRHQKWKTDRVCEEYIKDVPVSIGIKIIGGREAGLGEFPHMVGLGYESDKGLYFDCGGTLISDRFVLTSAQCVVRKGNSPPVVVRVGTVNLDGKYDTKDSDYFVAETIVHPQYSSLQYYNDVALVKLEKPVVFNGFVHPACLNTDPKDPTGPLIITGWGSTSLKKNSKSIYLRKATVTAVPIVKCNSSYNRFDSRLPYGLLDSQMCAVDRKLSADTCGGDGGGPIQVAYTDNMHKVFGITSFGQECGSGVPSAFVRVSSYLEWIESHVWQ